MTSQPISPFAQALGEHVGAKQAFRVAIVVASHTQPSQKWIDALNAQSQFATIIIVDDSDGKSVFPENWDVYDYARQKEELGDYLYAQFEQFHHSSSCKNFGTWLAYQRGFDPIIVIDHDCVVPPDFVGAHINALLRSGDGWSNPLNGLGFYSRGFPYHLRGMEKWAHMGLWENELDLYGTDRIGKQVPTYPPPMKSIVDAQFFPLSGMNVSFRNAAIPFMLFLPNAPFKDEVKFTRHDDIWGGYIFQKFCQRFNKSLSFGEPYIIHDSDLNPKEDAEAEIPMISNEKEFYEDVDLAFGMGAAEWETLLHQEGIVELWQPAFRFWIEAFISNQ